MSSGAQFALFPTLHRKNMFRFLIERMNEELITSNP